MANGNGNGLTAGAVITLCLAMLVASNGIMFWGLSNLKEQINEKSADRYTGSDAEKDKQIYDSNLNTLEWRVHQLELFVKDYRDKRRMASDS